MIPKIEEFTMCVVSGDDGNKYDKFIICQLPNGKFLDGYYEQWKHAEPITEKKKRWMTREEVLLDMLNNPRRLVKVGDNSWVHYNNFFSEISEYEYIDIPENYQGDFSDLEIKKFEREE